MARLNAANNVETELTSAVTNTDTKMDVKDASKFPAPPFLITMNTAEEIVKVTFVSKSALTVERGQEGTTAQAWDASTPVAMNFTAGMYDELETEKGAQDKADKAESNANSYTDKNVFSGKYADLPDKPTIPSKASDVNAASQADFDAHKADDVHVPSGLISMWSGNVSAIPSGWNLCDGANGTPDLRNRFIVGAGGSYNTGDTGGVESVTLSTSELPEHSHGSGSLSTSTDGYHSHKVTIDKYAGDDVGVKREDGGFVKPLWGRDKDLTTTNTGSHSHSITGTTSTTGGGEPHENRPPYYALAFIMKT